jgi:hypothetical protein
MATQDYAASVQGVAIRVTRLNANGTLSTVPGDSITTTKFIRVSFTPEYEDGDEILEKAADGTICVSFKAPDVLKRVNCEIAICEPDPEITQLLSGGLLLTDAGGMAVGWSSALVGEDVSGYGCAVEVWSRAIQSGKPSTLYPYYHWIFPYVKTRQSGDRVIENGLLANTFEGWGVGNMAFGRGCDGRWEWPQADDRPYSFARSTWAPVGYQGSYTWNPTTHAGTLVTDITDQASPPDINVMYDAGASATPATGMVGGNVRPAVDNLSPFDYVYESEGTPGS